MDEKGRVDNVLSKRFCGDVCATISEKTVKCFVCAQDFTTSAVSPSLAVLCVIRIHAFVVVAYRAWAPVYRICFCDSLRT